MTWGPGKEAKELAAVQWRGLYPSITMQLPTFSSDQTRPSQAFHAGRVPLLSRSLLDLQLTMMDAAWTWNPIMATPGRPPTLDPTLQHLRCFDHHKHAGTALQIQAWLIMTSTPCTCMRPPSSPSEARCEFLGLVVDVPARTAA